MFNFINKLVNIFNTEKEDDGNLNKECLYISDPKQIISNMKPIVMDKLTISDYIVIIRGLLFNNNLFINEEYNNLFVKTDIDLKTQETITENKQRIYYYVIGLQKDTVCNFDELTSISSNTNIYTTPDLEDIEEVNNLKANTVYLVLNIGNPDSYVRYKIISNIFDIENETYISISLNYNVWLPYVKWGKDLHVAINLFEIAEELINTEYNN